MFKDELSISKFTARFGRIELKNKSFFTSKNVLLTRQCCTNINKFTQPLLIFSSSVGVEKGGERGGWK